MAISTKPTQDFVPIKEIRDGVVVLKDGSLRMVLMASTLNFSLKSDDEQNAIVMQYQNFLNSLDFKVQFFIESRKLDIAPYIASLQLAGKEQANELLKIQTMEYIEFIKNFIKTTNVVSKTFYVIIPYEPSGLAAQKGVLESIGFGGGRSALSNTKVKNGNGDFAEQKQQITQRVESVQQGLSSAGVKTIPLNTEELIELFYKLYNPGELEKEMGATEIGGDRLKNN